MRSARYAEDENFLAKSGLPIDERNNRCLMAALDSVEQGRRSARYRCVLVAAKDGEVICIGEGLVEGVILTEARGAGGFGYDPYFAPEGLAQSMAELDASVRLGLSHRGKALRDLLVKLKAVG